MYKNQENFEKLLCGGNVLYAEKYKNIVASLRFKSYNHTDVKMPSPKCTKIPQNPPPN